MTPPRAGFLLVVPLHQHFTSTSPESPRTCTGGQWAPSPKVLRCCECRGQHDQSTLSFTMSSQRPMIKIFLLASALIISAPVHASSTTDTHSPTPAGNVQATEQAQLDQGYVPKIMKLFGLRIARRSISSLEMISQS